METVNPIQCRMLILLKFKSAKKIATKMKTNKSDVSTRFIISWRMWYTVFIGEGQCPSVASPCLCGLLACRIYQVML